MPAPRELRRLLVTGAAGRLGRILREGLTGYAGTLRLSDSASLGPAAEGEEVVQCDLADRSAVAELVSECDGIVHLGAISTEAAFDDLLHSNMLGTYNIFEGARIAGIRRLLFASSNHVVGFHTRTTRLDELSPYRPDTLYGVSKCFGEALARYYHDKFGIETVCVRIGSCVPVPQDLRMLSTWLSPRDFVALVKAIFDAPITGYLIVYGVSANRQTWWSNDHATFLGWQPQDSSESFRQELEARFPAEDPNARETIYQGGRFATAAPFDEAAETET
jgi:uronate dehydrogenase